MDMAGNGTVLARYYDALTPQERLVLLLQARARGDEREEERLLRSCPRRHYSMREAAFTVRVMMLEGIVWALHWDLGRWLAQLRLLDTVRRLVANPAAELLRLLSWPEAERAKLAHLAELCAADALWQEQALVVDDLLDALWDRLMGEAQVVWTAFGEFCRQELGLAPEVVLSALPHGQNLLDLVQEHLAPRPAGAPTAEPDTQEVDPSPKSQRVDAACPVGPPGGPGVGRSGGLPVDQGRVAEYRDLLVTAWRRALPETM